MTTTSALSVAALCAEAAVFIWFSGLIARLPWRRRHLRPLTERQARARLGMPANHPESLTAELPAWCEEMLAAKAAETWPEDEYADLTRLYLEGGAS